MANSTNPTPSPTAGDTPAQEPEYIEVEVATDPAAYTDPAERPEGPKLLSPSRMDDYAKCPRSFFFKSVLRLPTEPSVPAAKGTVAHAVLEALFELPAAERTVENAVAGIDAAWESCLNDDYHSETMTHLFDDDEDPDAARAAFLADVKRFVENYFTMENPTRFDPDSCERWVRGWVSGHGYCGVIDRLDRITLPGGEEQLWVTDYKSGKMPKLEWANDKFDAMKVYAVLLAEELGEIPRRLRLVYIGEPGRDRILQLDINETVLANTRARMKKISESIRRSHRRWEWPTKTSKLCDWCDFQSICPAFDGPLSNMPVTVRRKVDAETSSSSPSADVAETPVVVS